MSNNFIVKPVRTAAALTTGYVAGTVIDGVERYNELVLYCYFTLSSLTSLNIKVESSVDASNYVQETNITIAAGVGTLNKGVFNTTEDGNFKIALPISATHVKVSAQGVGTVTNSSLAIDAYLQYV